MPAVPILFCSHVVEMGGAESVLVDLLGELDRGRFAPHLAAPGDGPLTERCRALGVPVHRVPFGTGGAWAKARSLPGAARVLRQLAHAQGHRLLVATSMIAGYAAVLAQHRSLPCLWHVHIVTTSAVARLAVRRAHAVLTPSRAGLAAIDPRGQGRHRRVVPNGVAAKFFAPVSGGWRQRLGVPADAVMFGIVGRLDPQKGHDVLLEAFARLPAPAAAHLVIAGGELFAANQPRVAGFGAHLRQRLAAAPGLAGRVHLVGPVDDPAGLFADLDAVVVPSLAVESAPRAIAEAQAAGCAVVASALGGTPEMIDDGVTGRLVPPGDVAALAQVLTQLATEPVLRRRWAAGGKAFAMANYQMATFARRCEDALAGALGD